MYFSKYIFFVFNHTCKLFKSIYNTYDTLLGYEWLTPQMTKWLTLESSYDKVYTSLKR